jgi:beta-glucosidase-like glycosyl hydrolase/predicted peptidase/uncharacterized protein YneR
VFTVQVHAATEFKFQIIGKVFEYGFDAIGIAIDASAATPTSGNLKVFNGQSSLAITKTYRNSSPAIDEAAIDNAGSGNYIILELGNKDLGNYVGSGSAYTLLSFDMASFRNTLALTGIRITGDANDSFALNQADSLIQTNTKDFVEKTLKTDAGVGGPRLKYQLYSPNTSSKVPLVIWLHGMGEGGNGTDATYNGIVQILGNEGGVGWLNELATGSALTTTGAALQAQAQTTPLDFFVAAPQAYTIWDWAVDQMSGTGQKTPEERLDSYRIDAMIKEIIADANGMVDEDRIYIAGCSMGGGQTFAQLIHSKAIQGATQFAGAFPICPAYALTDEDAELIKDIPMWIFQAANDGTVNPVSVRESVNKLVAKGAKVQYTEYPNVQDYQGQDYQGHWAWVRVLNNEDNVMEWLFDENKTVATADYQLIAPTISISKNGLDVTLSWEAVDGATGYKIYEAVSQPASSPWEAPTYAYTEIASVTGNSYTLTNLSEGEHSFLVTAVNATNESIKSGDDIRSVFVLDPNKTGNVATPTLSFQGSQVTVAHEKLTSEDYSQLRFFYTLDNSEPDETSLMLTPTYMSTPWGSFLMGNTISITAPVNIQVRALFDGVFGDAAKLTINPAAVTATVADGVFPPSEFPKSTALSLAFPTSGAKIYYKTYIGDFANGKVTTSSEPVTQSDLLYSAGTQIPIANLNDASKAFVIEALAVYVDASGTEFTSTAKIYYVCDPDFALLTDDNIDKIINQMSLAEKAALLVGIGMNPSALVNNGVAGGTQAFARHGIPSTALSDGPAGLRMGSNATVWLSPSGVASTWDTEAISAITERIAAEAKHYAVDIMLAPALNIQRNPMGGRDFEYYSEDPVVSGKTAAAYTAALQKNGIGVSLKHFAANNQEDQRTNWLQEVISERALREIYLRGYEIAMAEKPWTFMSSYNQINDFISASNKWLLTDVLRDEWGFDGYVMSDWGGNMQLTDGVVAGNDLTEPSGTAATIVNWVNSAADEAERDTRLGYVNRNAKNILSVVVKTASFNGEYKNLVRADIAANSAKFADKSSEVYKSSQTVNRKTAAEGMVLLKNDNGALPQKVATSPKVALVTSEVARYASVTQSTGFGAAGYVAITDLVIEGGGSAQVTWNANYAVTLAKGLTDAGYTIVSNQFDKDIASTSDVQAAADAADFGVFVISRTSSEGADNQPASFDLSPSESVAFNALAEAFKAKGKPVVVLINSGASVNVQEFNAKADAILVVWLPGTEGGNAIADIISGKVSPSGKLSQTFPVAYDNSPSIAMAADDHIGQTWGTNPAFYDEGVFVGYRYFDTFNKNAQVAYPFGHGLSYTEFEFGDLKFSENYFDPSAESIDVTVKVTNVGDVAGAEVVQLYLGADSYEIERRPIKELKDYTKIYLEPGESQEVTFTINKRDLQYFDDGNINNKLGLNPDGTSTVEYGAGSGWTVEVGTTFTATIGDTSDSAVLSDNGIAGEFVYGEAPTVAGSVAKPTLTFGEAMSWGGPPSYQVTIDHEKMAEDMAGLRFYYTTDGTDPTAKSAVMNPQSFEPYPGYIMTIGNTIPVTGPALVKVRAWFGGEFSEVAELEVVPEAVTATVPIGVWTDTRYPASTALEIGFPAQGAQIYYKTTLADFTNGELVPTGITVTKSDTLYTPGTEVAITNTGSASKAFVIETLAVFVGAGGQEFTSKSTIYYVPDPNFEILREDNIDKIVSEMTLAEKAALLVGIGMNPGALINPGVAGGTQVFDRLGIPATSLSDGPAGVRMGRNATVWLSPAGVASTWSTETIRKVTERIAAEAKHYAVDIMLAPALNIQRNPMGGRDFEYYSEDPVVSGKTASAYTAELQENGVGVSLKHFAANNQESFRSGGQEVIAERTLREIYLRGFEMVMAEEPWTVMSSYNRINDFLSASNKWLLTDVLRTEWGFDGYVMSDWGGNSELTNGVAAGNDLTEPSGSADVILAWVDASANATEKASRISDIDRDVKNILKIIVKTPAFLGEYDGLTTADMDANSAKFADKSSSVYQASKSINRQSAAEGMVLLKNDNNALPKKTSGSSPRVALVTSDVARVANTPGNGGMFGIGGLAAVKDLVIEGGGSAQVTWHANYAVTLEEGLKNNGYDVVYNKVDADIVGNIAAEAQAAAAASDFGIFVLSRTSSEGADNPIANFDLSETEKTVFNAYADAFKAVGKSVVVLINSGASVNVQDFNAKADAILVVWLTGTEGGNAIGDILSGNVNPSGKLTQTFPLEFNDSPSIALAAAGHEGQTWATDPVYYDDGVYVGYRYFDTFGKSDRVAYPFGHGLSYTQFAFSDLTVSNEYFDPSAEYVTVSVKVKNTGSVAGSEVVQLYLGADSYQAEGRPIKELKDYSKISLEPGETKTVTFTVKKRDLQYFDDANPDNELGLEGGSSTVEYGQGEGWTVKLGTKFTVTVGDTSDSSVLSAKGVTTKFTYGTKPSDTTPPDSTPSYNPPYTPYTPVAVVPAATPVPVKLAVDVNIVLAPKVYADELNKLGLLYGVGTDAAGNPVYELTRESNRIEALAFVIRLLGLEKEALAYTGANPFKDVPSWGARYAAFAYSRGIAFGIDSAHTIFNADSPITLQEFTAFLLRVLKYSESGGDFAYSQTLDKAVSVGLYRQKYDNKTILRSDATFSMVEALLTRQKNSEKRLIDALVDSGVITRAQANAFSNSVTGK